MRRDWVFRLMRQGGQGLARRLALPGFGGAGVGWGFGGGKGGDPGISTSPMPRTMVMAWLAASVLVNRSGASVNLRVL